MVNIECYDAKLKEIMAIKEEDIFTMTTAPLEKYIQAAETLVQWCQPDKEAFIKAGFNWKIVEEIPILIGALREAGSKWTSQRFAKKETGILWKEKSMELYELRNSLLHEFRYAYRKNPYILNRVNAIAGSQAYAALIQDLNDLAVLGRDNPAELKAINSDMLQLDKAAALTQEMAAIFAASTIEGDCSAAKKIRDQAFTLLKYSIDDVCACGQFLFWKDETRKKGYSITALCRVRKRKTSDETESDNGQIETLGTKAS